MRKRFPATDVGPADLPLLLHLFPDKVEAVAHLLGYRYDESVAISSDKMSEIEAELLGLHGKGREQQEIAATQEQVAVQFWSVQQKTIFTEPGAFRAGENEQQSEPTLELPFLEPKAPPAYPHLVPWPRLWPLLQQRLSRSVPGRDPDDRDMLRRLNRGEMLLHIPRKERRLWSEPIVLAVDTDLRHFPLFGEYDLIRSGLQAMIGLRAVQVCHVPSGPEHGVVLSQEQRECPLRDISRGKRTLILSDLGQYDSARMRQVWLDYGQYMQRGGIRPVVLTPVPRHKWNTDWNHYFEMLGWEELSQEHTTCDMVDTLLALAAPTVRVEPRLLRTLRRLLPHAGVETELLAWNHPDVRPTYLAFEFAPDRIAKWRTQFQELDDTTLQDNAVETHAAFHAFLSPEVQLEEQLSASMLLSGRKKPREDLSKFLRWLESALVSAPDAQTKAEIRAWMQRMAKRLDQRVRDVPGAGHIGVSLARSFLAEPSDAHAENLPSWILDSEWEEARGQKTALQDWEVRQIGEQLHVCRAGEDTRGCLLDVLPAKNLLEVRRDGISCGKLHLDAGVLFSVQDVRDVVVGSDWANIHLATMPKPLWADAITMRHDGLATLWNGLEVPWVLAEDVGRYQVPPYADAKRSEKTSGTVQRGVWQFPDRSELSWAARIGEDQYGLYAEFDFQGITQRMRWIMPGTFLMGSSKKEVDRENDETQHKVTLSHGFWLADTTCTQELWQAVMGDNPSHFGGQKELPVENVSWDMCQEFCTRINKSVPGLGLRLPAEAQWEYACRAGTITPFSFGDNITTEQVNFNGDYPYNNASKGVVRQQTVPVRALPCNQWGLYQMHGNLWEWCADWYGKYPRGPVTDPEGPKKGVYRVLRGGGWFDLGRYVRSADRYWYIPSFRYDVVGFRFSRGHQG